MWHLSNDPAYDVKPDWAGTFAREVVLPLETLDCETPAQGISTRRPREPPFASRWWASAAASRGKHSATSMCTSSAAARPDSSPS